MDTHGGTRHERRALELLESAVSGSGEDRGLVFVDEQSDAVLGVALYGAVAGASHAIKVHLLTAGSPRTHDVLAEGLMNAMVSEQVRIVVAEVPDETAFGGMLSALRGVGFVEDGHVADWFAEGVGLRLLSARPAAFYLRA